MAAAGRRLLFVGASTRRRLEKTACVPSAIWRSAPEAALGAGQKRRMLWLFANG
ncbi:MAG: hypothetical protein ACLUFV_10550 [Acutalibacteraceae bacterium]